ncbi:MAG TPA: hypothetical protein VFB58_06865 [Chloroflexota bacterium]|nr:hypothetical protein [Chloroflexota bacterium]
MRIARSLPLALLLLLVVSLPAAAGDARTRATGTWTGSGWTLTLTFPEGNWTHSLQGRFRSARQSFPVRGDWIPAGDQGSYLLRFYGHPFTPSSPMGLVGVAILYNTCTPNCAASRHYKLVVDRTLTLPKTLPGTGTGSLALTIR